MSDERMTLNGENLKVANFDVMEIWTVVCPECYEENLAEFNEENPMQPMKMKCESCGENFILTYDRDLT